MIRKQSRKQLLAKVAIFTLVLLFAGIGIFALTRSKAIAGWWNDNWQYRKSIPITNSSGSDQTDYQIKITVDTASMISSGKLQSNCYDLRFTDYNGDELPYWIEEFPTTKACNQSTTNIWIKLNTSHTDGDTILMYYGNPTASRAEDGDKTFAFFDDFDGTDLSTKWRKFGNGTVAQTSGYIYPTSYGATCSGTGWQGTGILASLEETLTDNFAYSYYIDMQNTGANNYLGLLGLYFNETGAYDTSGYLTTTYDAGYFSTNGTFMAQSTTNSIYSNTSATWTDMSGMVEVRDDGTNGHLYYDGTEYGTAQTQPSITFGGISLFLLRYCNSGSWLPAVPKMNVYAVHVRKYVTNGPAAGTIGSEEITTGPIGYWKFDEGFGTETNDQTANKNAGSISGALWQTEDMCISGRCLFYDGNDDTTTVNANNTYDQYNRDGYSICGWIKPISDGEGSAGEWWSKGSSYLRVDTLSSNTVEVSARMELSTTPATYNSTETIDLSTWNHICMGYTNDADDEITLYINGKASGSSTNGSGSPANDSSYDMYIGGDSSNNFNGFIDEVKIYPYERSTSEVLTDYQKGAGSTGSAVDLSVSKEQTSPISNGLVGYWKMDEGSWNGTAGEVKDASGNGNNGTRGGDATTAIGKFGNGGTFDGTGDYINFGDPSSLALANAFTFNAYVNPTSYSYNEVVYYGGAGDKIWIRLDGSGKPKVYIGGSSNPGYHTATGVLSTSTWNFLSVTYDGNELKIYINGTLDSTFSSTGSLSDSGTRYDVKIGSNYNGGGDYFIGSIDEARIYNRALSPAEVQALYKWAPGSSAYYKFDEGSWTNNCSTDTVFDSSSNNRNGYSCPSGSGPTTPSTGKFGNSVEFDGSNSYVQANFSSISNSQFSLEAWINLPQAASAKSWMQVFESGVEGISITVRGDTSTIYCTDDWTDGQASSATLSFDEWMHIACTYDSNGDAKLYINGVLKDTHNNLSPDSFSSTSRIGARGSSSQVLLGKVDDFHLYNYARTQEQIVSDMNAGHPAPGSPVGSAYIQYRMDEAQGSTAHNAGYGGSGVDGSVTSGTWTKDGKYNNALTFTASTTVTATITDPGYTNTISLWVYPTTSAASKTLVTSGKLATNGSSQPTYGNCTGTALSLNTWTHITAVSNGSSSCAIYQNGKLTSSSTTGVTFGTSLNIGGSSFTGSVDEFKFYSSALTASQAAQEYNLGQASVLGAFSTDSSGNPSNSADRAYCPPGDTTSSCGPVAEWKFDEKTGQMAYDTSTNEYNGTLGSSSGADSSDPSWTTGKFGQALNFNGSNQYINLPSLPSITAPYTVELWFNTDDVSTSMTLLSLRGTNTYPKFTIFRQTGINPKLLAYAGAEKYVYGNTTFTTPYLNKWHHAVFVVDSSSSLTNWKIYLDGRDDTGQNGANTGTYYEPGSTGDVGRDTSHYFSGAIDQIRIYDYARTPAQVAWDYNRGKPVAKYKLDECSGSTAHSTNDIYNSSLNGTIVGGGSGTNSGIGDCTGSSGTMWKDGVSGKYSHSLEFDGTDDYVDMGNNSLFDFGTNDIFSVSAWVKLNNDYTSTQTILQKQNYVNGSNNQGYSLRFGNTDYKFEFHTYDNVGSGILTANQSISDNNWHMVIATFDGINKALYIDGDLDNTGTYYGLADATTVPFYIGRHGSGGYFNGQIDEIQVFNYELNAKQVKSLYNDGAVNFSN